MMRLVNPLVDHVGSWVSPLRWRTFTCRERRFRYCVHRYNRTWANERAIEIPLATLVAGSVSQDEVLEVGNVLAHYGQTGHAVIDKYEKHPRAMNIDILAFNPMRRFERIISISTVEHVGWDESPRSRDKAILAVDKIKAILSPTGCALVTFPLGFNRWLDSAMFAGRWDNCDIAFMQRVSRANEWRQVLGREAEFMTYGVPFHGVNCLAVMFLGGVDSCVALSCDSMFGHIIDQ